MKAMYRRVLAQAQPVGKDEVQQCLNEVCRVKNDGHKARGFSASQWVLGHNPRTTQSFQKTLIKEKARSEDKKTLNYTLIRLQFLN